MEVLHFISGLPRSGSTLLCNILSQHPRIHATSTSGVIDLLLGVRNHWQDIVELRASPDEGAKRRVLRGILDSFHAGVVRPVVLDKSRAWTSEVELLEDLLERKIKILVPVRDIRDILASFEKIWRRNYLVRNTLDAASYLQCQTVEGRCHYWLRQDQTLGIAYGRVVDALHRGFKDRMHFVHFEELTAHPQETMNKIYDFLGEEPHKHNFECVEQVTIEDDSVYGMGDLHTIRPKVEPSVPQWPHVLGAFAEQFKQLNF